MRFVFILIVLDALMFGGAETPRLRRMPVAAPKVTKPCQPPPPPVCYPDGEGGFTCYPVDPNCQ